MGYGPDDDYMSDSAEMFSDSRYDDLFGPSRDEDKLEGIQKYDDVANNNNIEDQFYDKGSMERSSEEALKMNKDKEEEDSRYDAFNESLNESRNDSRDEALNQDRLRPEVDREVEQRQITDYFRETRDKNAFDLTMRDLHDGKISWNDLRGQMNEELKYRR